MINSGDRPAHLLYILISYLLCNFLVHVWTTNLIRVTCLYVCFCNIWVNGRSKRLLSYFTGFIRGGFFCAAVFACFSLGHGVFEPFSFLSFCDPIMTLFCFFAFVRSLLCVYIHRMRRRGLRRGEGQQHRTTNHDRYNHVTTFIIKIIDKSLHSFAIDRHQKHNIQHHHQMTGYIHLDTYGTTYYSTRLVLSGMQYGSREGIQYISRWGSGGYRELRSNVLYIYLCWAFLTSYGVFWLAFSVGFWLVGEGRVGVFLLFFCTIFWVEQNSHWLWIGWKESVLWCRWVDSPFEQGNLAIRGREHVYDDLGIDISQWLLFVELG